MDILASNLQLSKRHEWMLYKLQQCYSIESSIVEKCIRDNKKKIDQFLCDNKSCPKLYFYYQPRQFKVSELYMCTSINSDTDKLLNKICWFIRDTQKSVNIKIASDSSILCGECQPELLHDFESVLHEIYKPLLLNNNDSATTWGKINQSAGRIQQEKSVFLHTVDKFDNEIKKKLTQLRGDVELRMSQPPYDTIEQKPAAYSKASKDNDIIVHYVDVVTSWCDDISKYMCTDVSSIPLSQACDDTPQVEFDYWNRRMLTLISITEQLKNKQNRVVTGVLKARVLNQQYNDENMLNTSNTIQSSTPQTVRHDDISAAQTEQVRNVLERWRDVDLAITDALNEAKDNVRFLDNLAKVIDPLQATGTTQQIIDCMPALMNSMKMIHTLSRHYGTDTRMTNLFVRITNQLIECCRNEIYQYDNVNTLWLTDATQVIKSMRASIELYTVYESNYNQTKAKLSEMSNGKQFNFDINTIFGKFQKFICRLEKLIDMFSCIVQFDLLHGEHIDGLHTLIQSFYTLINEFKLKGHDLLDINNTVFERDYLEFTMHNSGLENCIQLFISTSLNDINSIDKQLDLLYKFSHVLQKQSLHDDLQQKYLLIFKQYGDELNSIQSIYERYKDNPPVGRNMSRISGNIQWSRQLLRRITTPIKKFQLHPSVFHPKESKKIVKHYNRLARILIEFETLWYNAWCQSCEQAKRGLRSKLIIHDGTSNELVVNFDIGVLQLLREAKNLQLMGFDIPASAKIVLLLHDKLKLNYTQLTHVLSEYHRIVSYVPAVCKSLLESHISDLQLHMKPGMSVMCWTSMNIDAFIQNLYNVFNRFEILITQINDIITNRINNNLEFIQTICLFTLPKNKTYTNRDFVVHQQQHMDSMAQLLMSKNDAIEYAVNDIFDAVNNYQLHADTIKSSSTTDQSIVRLHYSHMYYTSILTAYKYSIQQLNQRISGSVVDAVPLFETDLSLQLPNVTLNPTVAELQQLIEQVTCDMLTVSKKLLDWGIDSLTGNKRTRKSLYDRLTNNKQLCIHILLLHGTIDIIKTNSVQHIHKYTEYSWLWLQEPETSYTEFIKSKLHKPLLDDFIVELHKFVSIEQQINCIESSEVISCLLLRTDSLKQSLKHEVERWKLQYSEKLHTEAKHDMDYVVEHMNELKSRLEREVKDFASLKFVMDGQYDVRETQSWVDHKFELIIERYNILEKYLPYGSMSKDEMDTKSMLRILWQQVLQLSTNVMSNVQSLQSGYKYDLIDNVKLFKQSVKQFRVDYDMNGPMCRGTTPQEAMTRLAKYKREFETLNRKYELYNGGEKLFGLPEQQYNDLVKTKKELRLLDQLYILYQQVISTVDEYKGIPWSDVVANITQMNDTIQQFSTRCKHLPKGLKTWSAYLELNQTIEDFIEILPLLTELSKPAMRERHWNKISKLTGKEFDIDKFNDMKLRSVLDANLLQYREDIEEITDSAEKQLSIERKISEISSLWDTAAFELSAWKDRGDVILAGNSVSDIIEQLEDSQASLVQMLTQRHVTPFRDIANSWLKKLSDVNDTLEHWIKVQMLWMSLEAVFTGGDIARQMPADTRVFMKVDKEWSTRLMSKAKDVKIAIDCCQNEYIKNMLPTMFIDLEKCQKALDGYLEQKRSKFPRFYFVSNPALLLILSQGSDKDAVQQCFGKVFDAIDRVEFTGNNITKIKQLMAGHDGTTDTEDIQLSKPVAAKGNIEEWLNLLLREMRRTIKDIVRAGANDYEAMQWSEFISKYPAQVSLLAIQFMWTADVQEALQRVKHDKLAMNTALKKQSGVLSELSSMTTRDMCSKMDRTKIETLVTIQVHQKDVLMELVQRYKDKKLKDIHDFEWQKQLRCYWVSEDDECVVKIADVEFAYCYEYLGCKERLVVTPLTDRCYISLSQAIGMCFGGAPAGPAGTGKTETVKDLGRALGKLVVVFNCSDQMHTADTAKIYKGLCQSGAWGCFDEFNRIDLEVLSVVAQQVQAVLTAIRSQSDSFLFPGDTEPISIDSRCGFFITMNPGYAGDLGYEPVVQAWLQTRRDDESTQLNILYQRYIVESDIFTYLQRNVRNVVPVSQVHLITNCLNLLEGLLLSDDNEQRIYTVEQLERYFIYALCWSLGALLEQDDRCKFSTFICSIPNKSTSLPSSLDNINDTLYEYYVDKQSLEWCRWAATEWHYDATHFNFSTCLVPTVDSVRAEYLINLMSSKLRKPVLLVGSSGTAKTSVVLQYTNTFDNSKKIIDIS